MTWNTGQQSTFDGFFPVDFQVAAGLFRGAVLGLADGGSFQVGPPGFCQGSPLATATLTQRGAYTAVVKASDAEKPPKTAAVTLPITVA